MKAAIAFCVFLFAALALARPDDDHYTDRYDNVDVQEILTNKKLLIAYIKCLLDEGKCTPEGKELKGHIGNALGNGCSKCTEAQKQGAESVIGHLVKYETEYWQQLSAKYDPDQKYSKKYEEHLQRVSA